MALTTTSFSPNFKLFWSRTISGSTRWSTCWTLTLTLILTLTLKQSLRTGKKKYKKAKINSNTRTCTHMWSGVLMRTCVGTLQVNLNKPCPFWSVSSQCGLRDCAVKPCSPVSSSSRLSTVNKPPLFTYDWQKLSARRMRCQRVCERPTTTRWVHQGRLTAKEHWLVGVPSARGGYLKKKM